MTINQLKIGALYKDNDLKAELVYIGPQLNKEAYEFDTRYYLFYNIKTINTVVMALPLKREFLYLIPI